MLRADSDFDCAEHRTYNRAQSRDPAFEPITLRLCPSPHSRRGGIVSTMRTSDFDYHLPEERIAQTPIEPRDASRLLVLHRDTGSLEHRHFYDIGEYLRPGDVLVFNQTRVIPARLHGHKTDTGGKVELLLLSRVEDRTWRG